MAVVTTKSVSITNLDSTPLIENTIGEGAPGFLRTISDFVTAAVGDTNGSVYRLVRVPTNAKIKQVLVSYLTASTAGAADIEVFFSDSLVDGTPQSLNALANPVVQISGPADNKLFGTAKTLTGILNNLDITFANTFTPQFQNLPLWQVLVNLGATQFTADPGGFFDIGFKLTTTLTVTAGVAAMEVRYVE